MLGANSGLCFSLGVSTSVLLTAQGCGKAFWKTNSELFVKHRLESCFLSPLWELPLTLLSLLSCALLVHCAGFPSLLPRPAPPPPRTFTEWYTASTCPPHVGSAPRPAASASQPGKHSGQGTLLLRLSPLMTSSQVMSACFGRQNPTFVAIAGRSKRESLSLGAIIGPGHSGNISKSLHDLHFLNSSAVLP